VAKRMEGVVDRYTAQSTRSLFDQANGLAPLTATGLPETKTPVVTGGTNGAPLLFR